MFSPPAGIPDAIQRLASLRHSDPPKDAHADSRGHPPEELHQSSWHLHAMAAGVSARGLRCRSCGRQGGGEGKRTRSTRAVGGGARGWVSSDVGEQFLRKESYIRRTLLHGGRNVAQYASAAAAWEEGGAG